MIYFAQPTNGGPIRIGSSGNMDARLRTLGTWLPGGVETVLEFDGGFIGESILHQCFNPIRVERDWFRSCDVLWRFILDCKKSRPDWLPFDAGPAPVFDHKEVVKEFGGPDAARETLGYSSTFNFDQAGRYQTPGSYVYPSRILFQRLIRSELLPDYITEMHVSHPSVAAWGISTTVRASEAVQRAAI